MDAGTGSFRVGVAGEQVPRAVFSSLVGRPRNKVTLEGLEHKEAFIGQEAELKRNILSVRNPIQRGVVTEWDDMELLVHHAYDSLRCQSASHPVLLTERPFSPKANKEKMVQMMFESFGVPSVYIGAQGVLSLYTAGRTTGLVLDVGEGVAHAVPVYEGFAIPHAAWRQDIAGQDVTNYLAKLLGERGYDAHVAGMKDAVRDIKEKLSYVSLDYPQELASVGSNASSIEKTYRLPDGQDVTLDEELFRCNEALFQPVFLELEAVGIHEATYKAATKCDRSISPQLLGSIVVCGGATRTRGFCERLQNELLALVPSAAKVHVHPSQEPQYSVWIGGSVLASMATFKQMWITRKEYEETGAKVVHSKCA